MGGRASIASLLFGWIMFTFDKVNPKSPKISAYAPLSIDIFCF